MEVKDILSDHIEVIYDSENESFDIYAFYNKVKSNRLMRLDISMLSALGKKGAAEFVGERILLLNSEARKKIYELSDETEN